jgi:hypothetical protein
MSDFELSIAMPLDSEGFLRRSCPNCERELKWITAERDKDPTPAPEGGYFCPYCGLQGPVDAWWTEAQLEAAKALAYREVVGPQLEGLAASIERSGSDFVSFETNVTAPPEPATLVEPDDMHRIDFDCHDEPVKVADDWAEAVHCPICGVVKVSNPPEDTGGR